MFQIGDEVEVVSAGYGWGLISPGDKGFVTALGPDKSKWLSAMDIQVSFPMQSKWVAKQKDLILLSFHSNKQASTHLHKT